MNRITAIVPAAGESSRMGRPKALLPWGETTVLGQVLANLRSAGLDDFVVVHAGDERVVQIASAARARVVQTGQGASGTMTTSLQDGLAGVAADCAAVLIVLADQPMIGPEAIRPVIEAHSARGHDLVTTSFLGRRGHPVLFGRRYFAELAALARNESPRKVLERHADRHVAVDVDSETVLGDLDTPEVYVYWSRWWKERSKNGQALVS